VLKVVWLPLALLLFSVITSGTVASENYTVGVWNNFDFSRSAKYWSDAARRFGGEYGVVDLVVAQANLDGFVYLPFPITSNNYLKSYSEVDDGELYLDEFDANGLNVILSIQPLNANITQIIEILLSRYGHHPSIIGVNIDLEWKESGVPNYVNNEERDQYLNELKKYNSDYRLFLTYFKNYTHFPQDDESLVILYDGQSDIQQDLLREYRELAEYFNVVGIYTGYFTSSPPTASQDSILAAVPDTAYIIHTDDVTTEEDIRLKWTLYLAIGLGVLLIVSLYLRFLYLRLKNKD
jgi:hypothetical protein